MDQAVNPSDWGAKPTTEGVVPSEWGAKPVVAEKKGFWESLTEGGPQAWLKESLPGILADRMRDVREAEAKFQSRDEWNKERKRRVDAGLSLNGMEQWKLNRINEIVQEGKPKVPPQSIGEMWESVKQAAIDNPTGFAGKIVRGFITNPELLMTPEALPARMAAMVPKIAGAARTATEAVQIGSAAAGESALRQLVEYGKASPEQTTIDMAMTAGPIVAGRALLPRNRAQVAMAADLTLAKEAKAKGIEPSGELVRKVVADTETRVSSGTPLDQALKDALESAKVSPEAASDAAELVKGEVHAKDEKGPQDTVRDATPVWGEEGQAGVLREREQGRDLGRPQEAEARVKPKVKPKIQPSEAGKIEPALLKALGLSALGGTAYAFYRQDPKEAITGALATGGAIAAGTLLKKGVSAIADTIGLWDKRYRITHLTDDHQGAVRSAQLANYRFATQLRELVSNQKEREAITYYLQGDESIKLSPEAKQAAEAVREYFKQMGEKANRVGVIEQLRDMYVTQLWTGLNKNDSLWRNIMASLGRTNTFTSGMSPKSRFNIERVIPSYKEGIKQGLVPSTLDIADIVRIYGDNVATAIANKNFIAALKRESMPNGEMIMGSPEALTKSLQNRLELTREQWDGKDALTDDIRRYAERKVRGDYVRIEHPQMAGQLVHPDVAPVLQWFFDANNPNAATKLAYAVSVAAKRGIFSFSFFHNASLAQALLGTSAKGWLNVVNGNARELLRHGKGGDVLDELVRGGLNVTERPLEGDTTPFTSALNLLAEKNPAIGVPAKGIRTVQRAMDAFLWGVVQPTFKTAVAMAAFEKTLKRSPNLPRAEAAKAAASFTNDIFGGLDWFRIADGVQNKIGRDLALAVTSPSGRRFMQIMALAPDWTVATARTMAKAIPGISRREIAALHQGYVVRSALLYATIADGLNMQFTGHHFWQNQDPTMVDLGDGRKLQLSKHFMEPIHWLLDPFQQAQNKLGYLPKELIEQAQNKQWLSTRSAPPIVPKGADVGTALAKRAEHAAGGVFPITGQQAFEQGVMPALSGFFGFPVYGQTEEQAAQRARARAEEEGKDTGASERRARKRVQRARERQQAEREQ